jgi:DNA-binding Lrp family transcriptional regulator
VRFEQPPVVANYDETDHRILKELSQHPERSRKAAAEKLGLPLSTLRYRVDKLVENEVISGFIFNPVLRTVGTLVYRWLVEVKGKSTRITKGLEKFCEQHPHVVSLADCTGAWDYEIRVELYNAVEVPKFSDELMDHLGSSLNSLRIQSVIERLKWAGYPFSAFPG